MPFTLHAGRKALLEGCHLLSRGLFLLGDLGLSGLLLTPYRAGGSTDRRTPSGIVISNLSDHGSSGRSFRCAARPRTIGAHRLWRRRRRGGKVYAGLISRPRIALLFVLFLLIRSPVLCRECDNTKGQGNGLGIVEAMLTT